MRTLTIILCLALAQCGLSPAWAQTVEVPDVAPDYAEGGPEDMEFVTANAGGDLAMLYQVPTTPADGLGRPAPAPTLPLTVQAASGGETRLSVDVSGINARAERAGWPWYAWTAVVVCSVALVGLTVWAVSDRSDGGSHSHDSSRDRNVTVDGQGNTVTITYPAPPVMAGAGGE